MMHVTAKDLQIVLLIDLWDGRDALTGELLRAEDTLRHHYKILFVEGGRVTFIKYDCRLSAQVPLSTTSHGVVNSFANADEHARNFERVMKKLMRGEWATLDWWLQYPGGAENIESFEENLLRLGYVKPNNLAR